MKNNVSIGLNVVLLIAVVVLYVLHFSGRADTDEPVEGKNTEPIDLSIAYVNSDSLLKNYDFFKDLEKKLIEKRDKLNAEYQNRAEGLQKEFQNFQTTAGNMTISQARAVEEDLRKKQQNLLMYQDQLGQQLMQEEAKMNSELYDKVSAYLRDYGLNKDLQIVLTYTKGSGVLYANEGLDITDQVIVGLNETYKTEQNGDASTAQSDSTEVK
ncbi:MAG: OmpH family outer membrane protein [Cytophagales bacterium]|nr:OmpH family outer membrane protein [Cytophagales bacterium]